MAEMKIIFVCTGNTCRSPMAEGLLKSKIGNKTIDIVSRGLSVWEEIPPSKLSVEMMNTMDIDIAQHLSKGFKSEEVSEDTLVLTMTRTHKKQILAEYGHLSGKIFTLKEYVDQSGDVMDPYGGDRETYRSCAVELDHLTDLLYLKIFGGIT